MVKKVKNKVNVKDNADQKRLDVFTIEDADKNPLVTLNFNAGLNEEDLLVVLITRVAQLMEAGEQDICITMLHNSLRNAHAALILRETLTTPNNNQPTE